MKTVVINKMLTLQNTRMLTSVARTVKSSLTSHKITWNKQNEKIIRPTWNIYLSFEYSAVTGTKHAFVLDLTLQVLYSDTNVAIKYHIYIKRTIFI